MTSFTERTAVYKQSDGLWHATIATGFEIGPIVNGGFTMAYAVRAMVESTDKSDPISVNAHFLRPAVPGPIEIHVEQIKAGRTLSTVAASLVQNDKEVLRLLGTFGNLDAMEGPRLMRSGPPDLTPLDQCPELDRESGGFYPPNFATAFQIRHDPRYDGFIRNEPIGEAVMGGWLRLKDDEPINTMALVMFADAFPPAIFNTDIPTAWAPTVELTVHFRARPTDGWLRGMYEADFIAGGSFVGDLNLWDDNDQLVVQSRQMALLPKQT